MKRLFNLLLLLAALPCFARDKNKVIITGEIVKMAAASPRVVKINFCNPLIGGSKSARLDDQMRFSLSEEMLHRQNMTVQYENYFINLLVAPGDSVHLSIDASALDAKEFQWLKISGDKARQSTDLNKCVNFLYKLPYAKWDMSLSPEKLMNAVHEDYARYMKELEKYAALHKTDPEAVRFARKDIRFLIANYLGDYVDLEDSNKTRQQSHIDLFADEFFQINDTASFQSMLFPSHLSNYMYFITRSDNDVSAAISQERFTQAAARGVALLLKERPTESRDYMVYKFVNSLLDRRPGLIDSLPELKTAFTKAIYFDYLRRSIDKNSRLSFPSTPLEGVRFLAADSSVTVLPEKDMFAHLAAAYPGQVIYVDVYATWCGPCRAEFRHTPALHRKFEGKAVTFVNLCLQSEEKAWIKLVGAEKLHGENFYFNDDAAKLFMGTYGLPGYPSYLLINKKGQLVTTNAARPSEAARLEKQISVLLNE